MNSIVNELFKEFPTFWVHLKLLQHSRNSAIILRLELLNSSTQCDTKFSKIHLNVIRQSTFDLPNIIFPTGLRTEFSSSVFL